MLLFVYGLVGELAEICFIDFAVDQVHGIRWHLEAFGVAAGLITTFTLHFVKVRAFQMNGILLDFFDY